MTSILILLLACHGKGSDPASDTTDSDTDASDVDTDSGWVDTDTDTGFFDDDHDDDGWSAGDDCDDEDASVNPGATEVCDDGVDEDCDGLVDEGCAPAQLGLSDADTTFLPSVGNTYLGNSLTHAGDLNGDGVDDLFLGQPWGAVASMLVVYGPLGHGDFPMPESASVILAGDTRGGEAAPGSCAANLGDVNGDGWADVAVGTADMWNYGTGKVQILRGPFGTPTVPMDDVAVATIVTANPGDGLGLTAALGDDVDDDGEPDLILSAQGSPVDATLDAGLVAIFPGSVHATYDVSLAPTRIVGDSADARFGYQIVTDADMDGDGRMDLVASAAQDASSQPGAGVVHVFDAPISGYRTSVEADARVTGATAYEGAMMVQDAADFDGDGHADLLIGAPSTSSKGDHRGSAYVMTGPFVGSTDVSSAAVRYDESDDGKLQYGGWAVSSAADLDGDGGTDLLVSTMGYTGDHIAEGAVLVFSSPVGGVLTDEDAAWILHGMAESDFAGATLLGGHDLDGDGVPDILVGAPDKDAYAGMAWMVSGATL